MHGYLEMIYKRFDHFWKINDFWYRTFFLVTQCIIKVWKEYKIWITLKDYTHLTPINLVFSIPFDCEIYVSLGEINFKNGSEITGMDQLRNWQKVIGQ